MLMTLEEAKSSIAYYKKAHPKEYTEMGGDKITDEKIEEALKITDAVAGAIGDMSEDELFKKELARLCHGSIWSKIRNR